MRRLLTQCQLTDCTLGTAVPILAIAIIFVVFIVIIVVAIKLCIFGGRQRRGAPIGGGVCGLVRLDLPGTKI
jgi:hypothetical protein